MEDTKEIPLVPETPSESHSKGFIGSMLDLSFRSFVTPNLVKVLYFVGLAAVVYYVIAFLLNGGFTGFVWRIVLSPLLLLIGVILVRAGIEIIMVAFRILELLQRLESRLRTGAGSFSSNAPINRETLP
jgi:hypothetical protein